MEAGKYVQRCTKCGMIFTEVRVCPYNNHCKETLVKESVDLIEEMDQYRLVRDDIREEIQGGRKEDYEQD